MSIFKYTNSPTLQSAFRQLQEVLDVTDEEFSEVKVSVFLLPCVQVCSPGCTPYSRPLDHLCRRHWILAFKATLRRKGCWKLKKG
jgi:hypothetical protein